MDLLHIMDLHIKHGLFFIYLMRYVIYGQCQDQRLLI